MVGADRAAQRAVIYCRVSTKEQAQNLSLPTQKKVCADYCDRHGFAVDGVFVDAGESAKTTDRPEFQKLLAYCRENRGHVHFVVVYAVNRFARNSFDHALIAALLKKLGVTLRSATEPISDSSTGKLMENILASFAQFDNDVRSERTIAGMKAAIEGGRWTFHPPLGYVRRLDGTGRATIAPDPERAPLVRKAFELCATGLHNKRDVLRMVTWMGLRTLRGNPVSPQTFHQMLRNPIYAGWLSVPGWNDLERQRGDFEPIVGDELSERARAVLDGKRLSVTPHQRNHPDFPLRVFAKCSACDTGLTGSWSKGRTERYAYYRCRASACKAVNVRRADLEGGFVRYLDAMVPKPEYVRLFREIVLDVWKQKQTDAVETRHRLQRNLDDLLGKKDRIVDAFLHRGLIDQRTYQRQVDKLDEDITLAETALHDARLDELNIEGVVAFAEHVLTNPGRLWVEASLEQKQRLQKVLFPRGVTYSPDGRFGTTETSVIFRLLHALPTRKEGEASPTGFEPVLPT
jgi:site-specific DNA recombinase